ncbi:MAG: glycosyltransferase family 4 protein [Sulfuritalea sp.]|nr:glycosyltransferase family 4 protein [Sulfuritalea sp.]
MILGIDASNIRGGGGVTHLGELLGAAEPQKFGFNRVVLWATPQTLAAIADRPWLTKLTHPWLRGSLLWRVAWQRFKLRSEIRRANCTITFVPGGSYSHGLGPVVTMSQNLLPFDWREIRRFGLSVFFFKMLALRWTQSKAFRGADGVIFLTECAKAAVIKQLRGHPKRAMVIPHGVDQRFRLAPRTQKSVDECSLQEPFSLLYVSHIWPYKHPWTVARAVAILRSEGMPVRLDIVGGGYPPSMRALQQTIDQLDPADEFLSYSTDAPHDQVAAYYHQADLFVFASSCETFGQVLTEAMSAGLPIVSSDRAAMPEVLGNAGRYFDPENLQSLVTVLREVIDSPQLRADMAARAYKRAMEYSWKRCAEGTLAFIAQVARECGSRNEGID